MEPLGNRIRYFREQRGFTMAELAQRMRERGHSTILAQRIEEIEHGRRYVRAHELISFSRVLGVGITELLGVSDRA